jgi:hypothetical protein
MTFFGVSLPWLPVVLLYQMVTLFFLLLAATRKMESQRLHPLSRPQAIVAMLTFATLILGGIWQKDGYEIYQVASLYLLPAPALMFIMMITPSQTEYAKGLYRAQKHGRTRLPWWDNLSVNWLCVVILAAIVLVAGTLVPTMAAGTSLPGLAARTQGRYPLALAAAVLTVVYFGFALQYFQLRFRKRGAVLFNLFLFVVWFVPLLVGWIQAVAAGGPSNESVSGAVIISLSPLAGLPMILTAPVQAAAQAVQAAAITPILLFTFLFNFLLVGARRRVMKSVFRLPAEKPQEWAETELAASAEGTP